MTFRPAPPEWRKEWPLLLVSAALPFATAKALSEPTAQHLATLAFVSILWLCGILLILRHRFPGKPTLIIDAEGVSYRRGGRETALPWSEVEDILDEAHGDTMLIVGRDRNSSIRTRSLMLSADGTEFTIAIERFRGD